MEKYIYKNQNSQGSILILSILILAMILSAMFAILGIFIPKLKIAADPIKSSVAAFAADSATEWCIYRNRKNPLSPVASYSLNEGAPSITTADSSGNNLNGTLTNGPIWTTGVNGNAVRFDGVNDFINLGNPALLQMTGSMSLSAWVYELSNPVDDGQIVSKADSTAGWQLKSSPDTGPRTFAIRIANTSGNNIQRYSNTVRALNTWYHVTGVYKASKRTLDIYVNGVLDNGILSGVVPTSQRNAVGNAFIARRVDVGGYYINGIIDDVRIYNDAISQSRILYDMNHPVSVTTYTPTGSIAARPILSNGATYNIYSPALSVFDTNCREGILDHRAVGIYRNVARSFEISK